MAKEYAKTKNTNVICEKCSNTSSLSSCIKVENSSYCSQACSLKCQEMSQKKQTKPRGGRKTAVFDWGSYLDSNKEEAASINCFKHCMTESWYMVAIGTVVEVPLPKAETENPSGGIVYWFARIVKLAGYKAKLRYEGSGSDSRLDYWTSICSPDVHEIGWCTTNSRQLQVPTSLKTKKEEWREFLIKRLTGTLPYPDNFYSQFLEEIGRHKFCKGMILEVVDKMCVAAVKVARITESVDCRLHLEYLGGGAAGDTNDFWCHKDSNLIHPVGWAVHVDHRLHASSEYMKTAHDRYLSKVVKPDDCTKDMFIRDPSRNFVPTDNGGGFAVGMKLEAIDPLNLSTICIATIVKVLKDNYLMIGVDGFMDSKHGNDWFCYHATSASILPIGYCELHDIPLTPPKGYTGKFVWQHYLTATNSKAAPVSCFTLRPPKHTFKQGMKLEAVDLMDPRLICVATVGRTEGRLLRIQFDGWESSFDQWIDCESPDIYPVGWCEMVKYNLEGPKQSNPQPEAKRMKYQ